MAADPYKYFRLEAQDLLGQLSKGLLDLEKESNGTTTGTTTATNLVPHLLRVAHTLKGAARVVKQVEIADRAHAIEDELSPFRDGSAAISAAAVSAVLAHVDVIGSSVRALSAPASPAPPVAGEKVPGGESEKEETFRAVRADLAEMDSVLEGVSETHALLTGLRGTMRNVETVRHLVDLMVAQLVPAGETAVASTGPNANAHALATELRERVERIEREIATTSDHMDRELRQLREATEQLRLISARILITALERATRDAAETLSKKVRFLSSGGDIRLDSYVAEVMQGALIQIVRNAVAHGIEPAAERQRNGKAEYGCVKVEILQRQRKILFRCSDDGRGFNLDAVRTAAQKRGLLAGEAATYDGEELLRLLLRGGISTVGTVNEVAGRGVGLDIVSRAVKRLSGDINVRTSPGQGAVIEIAVPASLTSQESLLVEAAGAVAAIPLQAVRGTARLETAAIAKDVAAMTISFEDRMIPFQPLATLLTGDFSAQDRNWTTVVIGHENRLAAIGVDKLLGVSRTVVRPIPDLTPKKDMVSGVFLDSEGTPQIIFDAESLVEEILQSGFTWAKEEGTHEVILIVDDSLTTRMLEQSILETAGYEVALAQSAEEALEKAQHNRYALFLVDVEMPGMDGFSFIGRIRADPTLRHIPAILITSRSSPADKQRGVDVGAQGYVVKSEFNQSDLLALIRSLLNPQ